MKDTHDRNTMGAAWQDQPIEEADYDKDVMDEGSLPPVYEDLVKTAGDES